MVKLGCALDWLERISRLFSNSNANIEINPANYPGPYFSILVLLY